MARLRWFKRGVARHMNNQQTRLLWAELPNAVNLTWDEAQKEARYNPNEWRIPHLYEFKEALDQGVIAFEKGVYWTSLWYHPNACTINTANREVKVEPTSEKRMVRFVKELIK